MNKNLLYRNIPKVDILLEETNIKEMIELYSRDAVVEAIRRETEQLRLFIGTCKSEKEAQDQIDMLRERIELSVKAMHTPHMKSVINGTGTILHTNLGRAPIGHNHMNRVAAIATGYSNLEYNLEEGKRGERYAHFEELLCDITGAEAAIAVNNNAAAVMLILNTIAKGGEVIVSRGELVEIGGKFRIPDVMTASGATLVEVGTTNKTHYLDYEEAITEQSVAILKVHTSNFSIVGFTETVDAGDLVSLCEKQDIPMIEDLGSGVLIDLSKYGITYEPTVQDAVKKGIDIICFSGDKLLGGPQAGIIIGKKRFIDQMKKNPLMRALRIDKFTAATLELVLQEYRSEEKAIQNIPVLRMITKPLDEIEKDAKKLKHMLDKAKVDAVVEIIPCESQIGGGSLPLERIKSMAVAIKPVQITVTQLQERMSRLPVPIIPRIVNDTLILDLRTISPRRFEVIVSQLEELGL